MKRFFILISCILLIISLAIPAFAAVAFFDWHDYVASVTPGSGYDINDVFIPSSVARPRWALYVNRTRLFYKYPATFSYTYDGTEVDALWELEADFRSSAHINLSGIDYQDTLDVHFHFDGSVPSDFTCSIDARFYDADDRYISGSSQFLELPSVSSVGIVTIPVDLSSMPDNAVYVSFQIIFTGDSLNAGDSFSVTFLGASFEVLTPGTMPSNPMIIEPQDYLVNESSNGTTSILYVSVPASDLSISWNTLRNDDYSIVQQSVGNPFFVNLDPQSYAYWIGLMVYDKLDITDIVDGSTMSVDYRVLFDEGVSLPAPSSVRYQVRYFDSAGNLLDNVNFLSVPDVDFYDDTKLDVLIDKPSGAVSMSFYLQFMDISVVDPISFELVLDSINFVCDIPTMVRVQQETGRTNKLLDEIKDGWTPDPDVPPFKDDVDKVIGKEDQIIDSLKPDQTLGDLEDIQLSIFDNLLLYAGGFLAIQRTFDIFLDIPWLKMVLYVSLALGLLGAFLNLGASASRADRASKSKKGE